MRTPQKDHRLAGRTRRRRRILALLAAVLTTMSVAALPQAAQAANPTKVAVNSDGPAKLWSGTVRSDGPGTPNVPPCRVVHCDKIEVRLTLPPGTWTRPGGLQVAIRWDVATEAGLGLFVYRDNMLVAKSTAGVGTAQSVIIPSARNGA